MFTGLPLLDKLTEMGLNDSGTIRSFRTKQCPINLIALKKKQRDVYESYVSNSAVLVYFVFGWEGRRGKTRIFQQLFYNYLDNFDEV